MRKVCRKQCKVECGILIRLISLPSMCVCQRVVYEILHGPVEYTCICNALQDPHLAIQGLLLQGGQIQCKAFSVTVLIHWLLPVASSIDIWTSCYMHRPILSLAPGFNQHVTECLASGIFYAEMLIILNK